MIDYESFLKTKERYSSDSGIDVSDEALSDKLYDFQKALVRWALKKGRCALFEDCGLGKTIQSLEWLSKIGGTSLIVAPLCVAEQTIEEGKKFGYDVRFVRSKAEIDKGINITQTMR